MIWLTWRQFRTQATVVFAAVAVLAALLAATGPQLAELYDAAGRDLLNRISSADQSLYYVGWAGRPGPAGRHRPVLGRAADRPRTGRRHPPAGLEPDRHPHPLAGDQARPRRHWPP